jgi:hypothetical protein
MMAWTGEKAKRVEYAAKNITAKFGSHLQSA